MSGFTLLPAPASPLLDDELTSRWEAKEPEHYTHIRTYGERAGVAEEDIRRLQEGYAKEFARFGAFISTPDQVPGYRRVVKLDPGWSGGFGGKGHHVLLAVDDRGHMSCKVMPAEDGPHPSVMEMFERGRHLDGESTGIGQLNRFASDYRKYPINVAQRFWSGMTHNPTGESVPLPKLFADPVRGMIKRRIDTAHRLAAWSLMGALDPEIRRHMRGTQQTSVADALWLSGTKRPVNPERARILARNRLQASKAYPILSSQMPAEHIEKAIDEGLPLAPVLQEEFGLNRFELRHLRGVTWQKLGLGFRVDLNWVARAAQVAAEMGGLSRANNRHLHGLSRIARAFRVEFAEAVRKVKPMLADEKDGKARLSQFADASDMVEHLIDKLYVPAGLNGLRDIVQDRPKPADHAEIVWVHSDISPDAGDLERHALRSTFHSMSVKDIVEASQRWHRNVFAHDEKIVTLRSETTWRPAIGEIDCENGIVGKELCGSEALSFQGRREGHCVGGYDKAVVHSDERNMTLIFSIEKQGQVLGTLQVSGGLRRPKEDPDAEPSYRFSLVQLRGKNNADVDAETEKAADSIVRRINQLPASEIEAYLSDLSDASRRRTLQAELHGPLQKAKYDYWKRDQLEGAWKELSVYLPRATRKAGLDKFIKDCGQMLLPVYETSSKAYLLTPRSDGVFEAKARDGTMIKVGIRPFWETDQALVATFETGAKIELWRNYSIAHKIKDMALKHGGLEGEDVEPVRDLDDDFDEIPF